MRLDRILLEDGIVDEDQLQEALDLQRQHGGRLENHLLRLGYAREDDLVAALKKQFRCGGVCLSGRWIPSDILQTIPVDHALSKLLLPYEQVTETNLIRVACENPRNQRLLDDLNLLNTGYRFEPIVAVGTCLRNAILEHYRDLIGRASPDNPCPSESNGTRNLMSGHTRDILVLSDNPRFSSCLGSSESGGTCRLRITNNDEAFLESYHRSEPDAILFVGNGTDLGTLDHAEALAAQGVDFERTVTGLMSDGVKFRNLTSMLNEIPDPAGAAQQPLPDRIRKVRRALEVEANTLHMDARENLGTHGSLRDMNVIDLLQAMGPSCKTARISVSGHGNQLAMFLAEGRVIYADCNGLKGVEAIYNAITWKRGIWSIDPVLPEELPPPNVHRNIDSILLEACYRLDEQQKAATETQL